jgi:hypothetical protein
MLYPKPALAKLLLDKPELLKEVWQALDRISDETLMGEGVDCISWNRGN